MLQVPTNWPTPDEYEETSTTLLPDPKLADDGEKLDALKKLNS